MAATKKIRAVVLAKQARSLRELVEALEVCAKLIATTEIATAIARTQHDDHLRNVAEYYYSQAVDIEARAIKLIGIDEFIEVSGQRSDSASPASSGMRKPPQRAPRRNK